jgi:SRSO17 transposase
MIPIVSPPSWITNFSNKMKLSHHQSKHLSTMLTGLITSTNKTIDGITSLSMNSTGQRSTNKFFTKYDWDAIEANRERVKELQRHDETRWKKRGLGIIDDTIIEKTGKHIEATGKYFDHGKKRYVHGHTIVTLNFVDHKTSYGLDYRLYLKKGNPEFRTKIELVKELITEGIEEMQFPGFTFVFDSWYLCKDLVDHIESYNRLWIAACKSDRQVMIKKRYMSIAQYCDTLYDEKFTETEVNGRKLLVHHKTLYFKSLKKKARFIISKDGDKVLFLATNRSGTVEGIISDYMLRWSVETFYKDAKQYLGLDKCQMRKLDGIKRYWYLVLMAHSVLRLGVSEGILSGIVSTKSVIGKVKRTCIDTLCRFVGWVMESGRSYMEVTDMLIGMFK